MKKMNDRLPLNRLPSRPLPFSDASPALGDSERFTEAEMARIKQEFAARLKEIFHGLTDAEIARRCKVQQSAVVNYLRADRLPSADVLLQIERASGVNLHWLMTGKGSRRVELGDMFTEDEEKRILEMAAQNKRSFSEQVRKLTVAAIEFLKNI